MKNKNIFININKKHIIVKIYLISNIVFYCDLTLFIKIIMNSIV